MPQFLRKLLPGCPAEKMLDDHIEQTRQLSSRVGEMVADVTTTVFDRRQQPLAVVHDRRKTASR